MAAGLGCRRMDLSSVYVCSVVVLISTFASPGISELLLILMAEIYILVESIVVLHMLLNLLLFDVLFTSSF